MPDKIGVVPSEVEKTINQANTDITDTVQVLQDSFNNVLTALAENWGTVDGKDWVTNTLVPHITSTVGEICKTLVKIPQVVRSTAIEQAKETGNFITTPSVVTPKMGELTNNMKDSLGDGDLIGIYNSLHDDVDTAMTTLLKNCNEILGTTATNINTNCQRAFLSDTEANAVAAQAQKYVTDVQTSIAGVITEMQTQINTNTESCQTFERSIQAAGLQSGEGSGGN